MSVPKLLVVDDEPALGGFAAHAGRRAGFDVAIALNATDFATAFDRTIPDAVVLDLGMPDGDGHDILRFLASRNYGGSVLIISGFDRPRLEASRTYGETLGLHMLPPLSKPVRLAELRSILTSLRGGRPMS